MASKGWLRASVYLLLGAVIFYRLHQLGTITQVIAILLGFLSFALSLASQDLLKDLIAGVLILWEDQYAVGDVIHIDDNVGLVEKITLRVTQIRNLDGELITIPNGSIGTVRNLSSEWSRVNYAVEVSYDADVDRALEVIEITAQQLYQDPQWQE
ncbi:MAG: mechanosensitive ion channel domain-containing protein, partial [Xenococcus sp. (in: cyanobacteria)]